MGKININPDLSKIKQKALDVKKIGAEKTKEIIGDKGTVFVTKAQNHGFVIEK
jgi:predicted sugar kinase